MNDDEMAERAYAALQSDPYLMEHIENVKRAQKRNWYQRIWDKLKMSTYTLLGVWLGPDIIRTVMRWMGLNR